MKSNFLNIIFLFVLLTCGVVYAQESDRALYSMAVKAAKSQEVDSAFMYFRSILTTYPESKYTGNALFATGEYYFGIRAYKDAVRVFIRLVYDYPDCPCRPFALAYLLRIARNAGKESLAKDFEKEIATLRQLVLLFSEFKEQKYASPLGKKYRALYYIDRLEFYIDGELFTKISY